MYYRITMDIANPLVANNVDEMFGHKEWRDQPFMREKGMDREEGLLNYFMSQINAQFMLPFKIRFGLDDKVHQGRTKYFLIHVSNHVKAALLMKEVMWPLGDEEGMFDYSGRHDELLISQTPQDAELKELLVKRYGGKSKTFDSIREETWNLPFIERHYRSVIRSLREAGLVTVKPVSSKSERGIAKKDVVTFKQMTATN